MARFKTLKELYETYGDFKVIWKEVNTNQHLGEFLILKQYLFKGNHFYLPRTSLRDKVIKYLHVGGLGGDIGRGKTIVADEERYFCP